MRISIQIIVDCRVWNSNTRTYTQGISGWICHIR